MPRSGLAVACTTSSSDSGRACASRVVTACRSRALPAMRSGGSVPVGRPSMGQAISGGSSKPTTASEPGAPGGALEGVGWSRSVARCSGSMTWGGGSSASSRATMRRTYGSAMSTAPSRRVPARQRSRLSTISARRGSRPYTTTQPISHHAHSRWLVASTQARTPALPTVCTAAASGTGKPSSAGSAPVTCTKRWKNVALRIVVSHVSV